MLLVNINYKHYPRRGHVRGAFIYCAVDGGLTRFIFAAVSLGKVKYVDWRVASREDVTLEQMSIITTSRFCLTSSIMINKLLPSLIVEHRSRGIGIGIGE